MTKDEQARARLVEIALKTASMWPHMTVSADAYREKVRTAAGFKNPRKGHWCAAGLTAAMEDAGLVVPAPGTPARRGAVALLDFVARGTQSDKSHAIRVHQWLADAQPGDVIAWLQHPPPDPAGWRRGHVAVIVGVDDESITTVGWNEGPSPGAVQKRRLWRDPERKETVTVYHERDDDSYEITRRVPRSSTVLYRKPTGMLYGIARPVAR